MPKSIGQNVAPVLNLPPYGYMNNLWMWDVAARRVPDGATIDGVQATPAAWAKRLRELAEELRADLWPWYDVKSAKWVGDSVATAVSLTHADFQVIAVLRGMMKEEVLCDGRKLGATHQDMFESEDESKPGVAPYPAMDAYLAGMASDERLAVREAAKKKSVAMGPAPLRLKEYFQRPRPSQVSFLWRLKYDYELARSAVSPAMVSGHSLQGVVGRCGGYLAHRLALERAVGAVVGLQQAAVDFGDRRVFAGVHYPSDNLGSWYCALRFCD